MRAEARLNVECLWPERLIQRALDAGAGFERVERRGERGLILETSARGARIVEEICRRFSLPYRVEKRRGASAAWARAKSRLTLAAGMAVFFALCGLFFSRIWLVDVRFTGDAAELGDAEVFQGALAEMGIVPGASRAIDTGLLSETLTAAAQGYSFVGARLQGVRLLIEAAPEVPAPQVYDVDHARDLYADRDGIVLFASAQSGELCVAPGDAVKRGQVLIRGEEMVAKDFTRGIGALGEVIVRAWYTGSAEVPLTQKTIRLTGRESTSSRLRLPWREWTLAEGEAFSSARLSRETLAIGGLFVPVEIIRETTRETRLESSPVDIETASQRAAALALADAATQLTLNGPEDYELLRCWLNYEEPGGDALKCGAVYEIATNAAVTREILFSED